MDEDEDDLSLLQTVTMLVSLEYTAVMRSPSATKQDGCLLDTVQSLLIASTTAPTCIYFVIIFEWIKPSLTLCSK
uniref:Uncharacterized protein n=1 Tax=Globisporangium ultimum (strain ATCC 200006 / CBS 805.95 / DAOM BR144) TaxID=431595 RepID=K3X2A6_GLOUD